MAPHSSTLAWRIPWTEEPGRLWSMGSLRVRHNWVTELNWCIHIYNTKIYLQFSSLISKKKYKGGCFSFSMEIRLVILSDFKTNSEKLQNELSGENIQKPPYVLLFLPFMIHESRGSCYRHKLHMKPENLFIFNKKNDYCLTLAAFQNLTKCFLPHMDVLSIIFLRSR